MRARSNRKADSLTSVIKPRDFYSPGPVRSPTARCTSSRGETTHCNLEMNLSCHFKVMPWKFTFYHAVLSQDVKGWRTGRAEPAQCQMLQPWCPSLTADLALGASMARVAAPALLMEGQHLPDGSRRQPGSGASVSTPPALQQVPARDELVLGSHEWVVSLARDTRLQPGSRRSV